ncbi:MAG: prepilin-type N-terminal cleavage/methylation domain-containing protein [Clostridia bacterium]|nr:prepilin-type N-terminal cleavage/methylation domain-containing protein [Clostridia bacterium]
MGYRHRNRGFTLIEIVIVIAVLALLTAILILALPKAMDEANEKSALSDAKNTLTNADINADNLTDLEEKLIMVVNKSEKDYVFSANSADGEITPCSANPFSPSEHEKLVESLISLGMIDAPLSVTEIHTDEQFENVSIFSGGSFAEDTENYNLRIDVEKGKSMPTPRSGILSISWQVKDTGIATVHDNKITGKTVGETKLTAYCGNLVIEYELHVGERIDIRSFEDIKSAIEDTGKKSVFLYPVTEEQMEAEKSQLPVVIPEGKYVEFCTHESEEQDSEAGQNNAGGYVIAYKYDEKDEYTEAIFINDGGIANFENISIFMCNESLVGMPSDTEPYIISKGEYIPSFGFTVINQNNGKIHIWGTLSNVAHTDTIPIDSLYAPQMRTDELNDVLENTDYGSIRNISGDLILDSVWGVSIENFEGATLRIRDVFYIERLQNLGTVYELSDAEFVMTNKCGQNRYGLQNSGIIYSCTGSSFRALSKGSATIKSDGVIHSIKDCTFKAVTLSESFFDEHNLSDELFHYYAAQKATDVCITGGSVGEIVNCSFEGEGVVFSDCSPIRCVVSGTFQKEPDARILADGSVCSKRDGVFVVEASVE